MSTDMKRYMLFAGNIYYPGGGMNDFVGSYDDLDRARFEIKERVERYGVFGNGKENWNYI